MNAGDRQKMRWSRVAISIGAVSIFSSTDQKVKQMKSKVVKLQAAGVVAKSLENTVETSSANSILGTLITCSP